MDMFCGPYRSASLQKSPQNDAPPNLGVSMRDLRFVCARAMSLGNEGSDDEQGADHILSGQ
jgi:hypothetical protein